MKHEHEFVRAYWLRVFGVWIQVPVNQVSNVQKDEAIMGWRCRTCGEQGYEVAA